MSAKKPGPTTSKLTVLEQRRLLIAAYQRSGNMQAAMRAAGIRSPRTAYLWWQRFCDEGEAGLQPRSHARKTQATIPPEMAAEVCDIRRAHPDWGRRRIADDLTRRHGQQLVSAASVETILRSEKLWDTSKTSEPAPQKPQAPLWLGARLDQDRLLEQLKEGIERERVGDARGAIAVLYHQVWRPLEAASDLWPKLLKLPKLGGWLMRSRHQLAASLVQHGKLELARTYLDQSAQWLAEHRPPPGRSFWAEEGQPVSLRWEDLWLESYRWLGIVLRDADVSASEGYLQTALAAIQQKWHPVVPRDRGMAGTLERDLARVKLLRRDWAERDVQEHILRGQASVEETGSSAMLAGVLLLWAAWHERRAQEARGDHALLAQAREQIHAAVERVLSLVEQNPSPLLQTIFFIRTARLAHSQRLPVDTEKLRRAAAYCLAYGYGTYAQELLAIPPIAALLSPELLAHLRALTRQSAEA